MRQADRRVSQCRGPLIHRQRMLVLKRSKARHPPPDIVEPLAEELSNLRDVLRLRWRLDPLLLRNCRAFRSSWRGPELACVLELPTTFFPRRYATLLLNLWENMALPRLEQSPRDGHDEAVRDKASELGRRNQLGIPRLPKSVTIIGEGPAGSSAQVVTWRDAPRAAGFVFSSIALAALHRAPRGHGVLEGRRDANQTRGPTS